jgi:PAS domain S-box-containing protein
MDRALCILENTDVYGAKKRKSRNMGLIMMARRRSTPKKTKTGPKKREDLGQRAERLLSKRISNLKPGTRNTEPKTGDTEKLVEELRVHQIELEMQNEELRKAQAELEESRSNYADLYDFAPVAYVAFTQTGKIAEVNLTGAQLLGIERSRLRGRAFSLFVAPESRSVFRHHCAEVVRNKDKETCELKLLKGDGTFLYARMQSVAVGEAWIRSALLDITPRKEAEDAFLKEQLFRRAIENSLLSGIMVNDLEGHITHVNPAFCRMVGWEEKELVGKKPPFVYWPPEQRETNMRNFRQMLSTKSPSERTELRLQRKNGERFHALLLVSALKDTSGKVIGYVRSFGDISELKRKEEEVLRLNRELEQRVIARTAQLETANERLKEEITERTRAEKLSRALNRIHDHLNAQAAHDEIMQQVLAEAARAMACDAAMISLKKDGRRIVSHVYGLPEAALGRELSDAEEPHAVVAMVSGKPVVIEDTSNDTRVDRVHMERFGIRSLVAVPILEGPATLGVCFFIYRAAPAASLGQIEIEFCTNLVAGVSLALQKNALIAELTRQTEGLELANTELKMFTQSLSHDLRNPLLAAQGFCQRLGERHGHALNPEAKRYLQRMDEACKAMDGLINDLLSFSKVGGMSMEYTLVDLSSLARSVAEGLAVSDPKRQARFVIGDDLHAEGDPTLLRTALENLLGNAWKFTSKRQRTVIEFGSIETGAFPAFFVRDNGCGFDMKFAEKLFQPFQRLHSPEEFSGTGMGLASVHRIVERHGGRIWVESILDQGTTFFFTLAPRYLGR